MSTEIRRVWPGPFSPPASAPAQWKSLAGKQAVFAFDGTTEETMVFGPLRAVRYGSGSVTARIRWGGASATSGDVKWGVSLACITPDNDTGSVASKAFATEATVVDTHLGTTADREMTTSVALSGASLDSIAADDEVYVQIARKAADVLDTMN